jgi:hypothetical protein
LTSFSDPRSAKSKQQSALERTDGVEEIEVKFGDKKKGFENEFRLS